MTPIEPVEQDYDWRIEVDIEESEEEQVSLPPAFQSPDAGQIDDGEDYGVYAPKKLTQRPLLMIGIVSGTLAGGLFLIIALLWGMTSLSAAIKNQKNKTADVPKELATQRSPFDEDALTESEEDILRAKLSAKNRDAEIAEYNETVAAQDKPEQSKTPISSKPKVTVAPRPQPSPERVQAPKVVYRSVPTPQLKPQTRIVYRERPSVAPQPVVQSRPTPNPVVQPPPTEPIQQVDPYETWNQLAGLGSIHGGDVVAAAPRNQLAVQNALYSGTGSNSIPVINPSAVNALNPVNRALPTNPVEPQKSTVKLPLGTTVKGKLLHDITFTNGTSTTDKAVIELSDALGDIPGGAKISAQIHSVDDTGALSMSVLGYEVNKRYTSISLPGISVTSKSANAGGSNTLGRIASSLLNIGLDILSEETGQTIDFENGQVSRIQTESGNDYFDRAIDATASELLEQNNNRAARTPKAPRIKKGTTVYFVIKEPFS